MDKNKYVFVQRDIDDFSCIKLTSGKFSDIIYTYGKVKFADKENSEGQLPLQFTYDVQKNPNNKNTESEEFRNVIGDILIEVMEEQIEQGRFKINE